MLVLFPSGVFQCFSKIDKWGWFTKWPPLSFNERWKFHQSYMIQRQHLLKMISYFATVVSPRGAWWALLPRQMVKLLILILEDMGACFWEFNETRQWKNRLQI